MSDDKNIQNVNPDGGQSRSLFANNWKMEGSGNDAVNIGEAPADICIPAILALIVSLFSFLLFLSTYFAFVPVLAFVLVVVSGLMIKKSGGRMAGGNLALLALWILLIPSIAVPVMHEYYQSRFHQDAKRFAAVWFERALAGDFTRVKQFSHSPHIARSSSGQTKYWMQYIGDEEQHEKMHRYLANELLLTLAALGNKASVSYYKTYAEWKTDDLEDIRLIYAVTCPNEKNEKTTFFVGLNANRYMDEKYRIAIWKGGDKFAGPLPLDANGEPVYKPE